MRYEKTNNKKINIERIAEAMDKVPDDKKEIISAMLIGICQGVQIADQMQQATA